LDRTLFGDANSICSHITALKVQFTFQNFAGLNENEFSFLVPKATKTYNFQDVTTLHLTPNPEYRENEDDVPVISKAASMDMNIKPKFICPISGKEINGRHRFFYLVTCGHVFAESVIREVPTSLCLQCNQEFSSNQDLIPINPTLDELPKLHEMIILRRERQKLKAKIKRKSENGSILKSGKKRKASAIVESSLEGSKEAKMSKTLVENVGISTSRKSHIAIAAPSENSLRSKPSISKSAAINSIYSNKDSKPESSNDFFVRGTYNRY
jgi:hypothetical protein